MEAFRLLTILSLITNVFYCVHGDNCSDAAKEYNQCTKQYDKFINTHVCVLTPDIELTSRAYEYYKNALKAGEDGRPDFKARKSCNYMTEAVEVLFS